MSEHDQSESPILSGGLVMKAADLARRRSADAIRAEAEAEAEAMIARAETDARDRAAAILAEADARRDDLTATAEARAKATVEEGEDQAARAAASAERRAAELVAEAEARASAILSDAEERAAQAAAAADGELRSKVVAGLAQAQAAIAAEQEAISAALIDLALDCARRIVDWTPDEERVAALCRRALADLGLAGGAALWVAPERLSETARQLEAAGSDIVAAARADLRGDAAILETRFGSVDLDVKAQLTAIAQGVAAQHEQNQSGREFDEDARRVAAGGDV